ncbi:MAG: CRISPR system precrRNA processing endoribonuclease RAMP protein Cas6 [Burkholderiales bacterium]|nr:CRISPR system precrRNA processing endoribonuclease RAMP protein Cas6 [Burkholderiales bacterium]
MGHPEPTLLSSAPDPLHAGAVLPIARYRFLFRMEHELILPEYAGSLLRGQFGAALRRTACMTGARTCAGCPLLCTCPYPAIFETPAPKAQASKKYSQVPNPYVIEPPPFGTRCVAAGERLEFGLVLFGRALDQLPLVAFALERAFGRGIGNNRVPGRLDDIVWQHAQGETSVWEPDERRLLRHVPRIVVPPLDGCRRVRLDIATPLRLQSQGHPLGPAELTPRKLLTALLRRAGLLFDIHADRPDTSKEAPLLARRAETLVDVRDLQWRDWTRYSSRQRTEMTLGGVVGRWEITGDLGPLASWLWLGQWLHVGKNVTMGMGCYKATFCPA